MQIYQPIVYQVPTMLGHEIWGDEDSPPTHTHPIAHLCLFVKAPQPGIAVSVSTCIYIENYPPEVLQCDSERLGAP